jgi:hypothetical protein
MANVVELMPEISGEEQTYIGGLLKGMSDKKAATFAASYRMQRKDPQNIMILTLLGFVLIAGVQRFVTEEYALGVIYLLTGGLCGIGTIIDLVSYKQIAFKYNQKQAHMIAQNLNLGGS